MLSGFSLKHSQMEKKQGFLSSLKDEVVRGLSPGKSRPITRDRSPSPMSGLLRRRKSHHVGIPDVLIARSGSLRPPEMLSPLREGPEATGDEVCDGGWGNWMKRNPSFSGGSSSSSSAAASKRSDLRLLLGVLGAPLAPVHVSAGEPLPHLSIKDTPIIQRGSVLLGPASKVVRAPTERLQTSPYPTLRGIPGVVVFNGNLQESSSAQYILQQYTAASGGLKLQNTIHNAYAMGKLKMLAFDIETPNKVIKNRNSSKSAESGGFVLWQMNPDMWYVELALGGSKVHAGCNGELVWRHTPWLGAHAAKGPVRPLRRALQGLDPRTTAAMFGNARCIGEKKINGEDCFILKLCADPKTLKARSEGPAEIIRHVLFGYFSQKTGLLINIEDSHLTRIQSNGGDAVYWETTINSCLEDYKRVEGIMIAHSGRSVVTLFRFGETAMSHTKTRMEEAWTIEEVAFNIPGLSMDCFIPPAEIRYTPLGESCDLPQGERLRPMSATAAAYRAKVASLDRSYDNSVNSMTWQMDDMHV